MPQDIKRILVANRGEIAIRVLRAAAELGLRTVSIFTHEDRFSSHRYKSDEAYQVGEDDDPLKPYLDIEAILEIAKLNAVDAIHPGYGFLSENVDFARRCRDEGIIFIGPTPEVMAQLGDKLQAKQNALAAGLPVIEDSREPLESMDIARREANRIGYPLMLKAVAGGGGRGMRVVRAEAELNVAYREARSEAGKAFGDDSVFLEKFIEAPKHVEVQLLGDTHGNLIHLYERDCSVQRRFQKVVEVAPSSGLKEETRQTLFRYALALARHVGYCNAGTVEFLIDRDENIYFIEVNPRIQVEHTVTEEVTGIDIVRSQIQVARGFRLSDPEIGVASQDDIRCIGYAIQCRITTEDPENNFQPEYGTLIAYRSPGGFGIRLDMGVVYAGARVSPFFDSLLVKLTAKGRTLKGAIQRGQRALREFRIRGVKTNIGFLENVLEHPIFASGRATVAFIDEHPELFEIRQPFDRATKTLMYLGNLIVNGNPDVRRVDPGITFRKPAIPRVKRLEGYPPGSKDLLVEKGAEGLCRWVKEQKHILYTDTTFRDAHQSLLATRVRTKDMLAVAEGFAKAHPQLFSLEMWGGATFDVAMRFLHECPWRRLQELREAIPNILFQMLFRGSNAVGYKAYPDNLIEKFIEESWNKGIDVFRIFDSLNWVEGMKRSIQVVRERTGAIAEAAICYTGDMLNSEPGYRYNLQYYLDLARRLEDEGAHMLALKDMAGLLKPYAAEVLIPALKSAVDIPIHLHTHDTSSMQAATLLKAIEHDVDIVDVCIASLSGLTSQVNMNSLVAVLAGHEREQPFDLGSLNDYANYWEAVREYYYPFESGLKSGTAEVYEHEIPGGQYSNLRPQAIALGLEHRFEQIKKNYAVVNRMFGDIVKVTPSSKVVGDMALFMTANGLTEQDVMTHGDTLAFPDSVVDLFSGKLGQTEGGFPPELSRMVLKGMQALTEAPGASLPPVDFDAEYAAFRKEFDDNAGMLDFLSHRMYPKVYSDFYRHRQEFGDIDYLPTPAFFYGMQQGEEILVKLQRGKTISIRYIYRSKPDDNGNCKVTFELNGQTRSVQIPDASATRKTTAHRKAVEANEVGSPLMGRLASIQVTAGDYVEKDQPLFVIEAMKMETTITAPVRGEVKAVHLQAGALVEQGDLVVEFG
jgi:pyruvate carboxylase